MPTLKIKVEDIKKLKKIKKENIVPMLELLNEKYPEAVCGLNYNSNLELVVALILAAQCTDNMVNKIIPILFTKYPTVYDLAKANVKDIQKIVKPCGYYVNKSNSIVMTANILVNDFNAQVPNTMEKLCTLRGIGRKSANIILQECFGNTVGIAVDTHVKRITKRIGLSFEIDQDKKEKELMKIIPKDWWNRINHLFVVHGRAICSAKKADCNNCPINKYCMKNI